MASKSPKSVSGTDGVSSITVVCKAFLISTKTPNLVIKAPSVNPIAATRDPIIPSPTRYVVPLAHPPARTIPIPNTKPPTTAPHIFKGFGAKSITPTKANIAKPIIRVIKAITTAFANLNSFNRIMSLNAEFIQNLPRCNTKPNRTPTISPPIKAYIKSIFFFTLFYLNQDSPRRSTCFFVRKNFVA